MINAYDADWGASLLGDKTYSVTFDNTKIKRLVPDFAGTIPFSQGAEEIIRWFDADSARQQIDGDWNRLIDELVAAQRGAWPS
jgi:hypothetical protein